MEIRLNHTYVLLVFGMIIYHVADLPVHHAVLHRTFPKKNSKISIPKEYPNIIPPTPRKAKPPVPPKLSRFHSLEPMKMYPGSFLETLMNLPVILMEYYFRSLLPQVPLGGVLIAVGDFLTLNPTSI